MGTPPDQLPETSQEPEAVFQVLKSACAVACESKAALPKIANVFTPKAANFLKEALPDPAARATACRRVSEAPVTLDDMPLAIFRSVLLVSNVFFWCQCRQWKPHQEKLREGTLFEGLTGPQLCAERLFFVGSEPTKCRSRLETGQNRTQPSSGTARQTSAAAVARRFRAASTKAISAGFTSSQLRVFRPQSGFTQRFSSGITPRAFRSRAPICPAVGMRGE